MDFELNSTDEATIYAKKLGINTWKALTVFVKNLPYSRNKNRSNFKLVLLEQQGTCSSKHALLKQLADLNHIPNVELILSIYEMNHNNTAIGNVLLDNCIEFIPEAHCYLKIGGKRYDFTSENSNIKKIEKDIISEINIVPNQVINYKVNYHKNFVKNWIEENNIDKDFNSIWQLRESCIERLTNE